MRYKGKWFWKKVWFSICSHHFEYLPKCSQCNRGVWRNCIFHKIESLFYWVAPDLWRKWIKNKHITK